MVFFVCEGCNESLKKNKVDTHARQCRNCYAVTCVDCNQTFHGDDFRAHTVCISEAEKYEGSLYKGKKPGAGKKRTAQEQWLDAIAEAQSSDSKVQQALDQLKNFENIPRKKAKFLNFIKNSLRLRDARLEEALWAALEAAFQQQQRIDSAQGDAKKPDVEEVKAKDGSTSKKEDANESQNKEDLGESSSEVKKERKKAKRKTEEEETSGKQEQPDQKKSKKRRREDKDTDVTDQEEAPESPQEEGRKCGSGIEKETQEGLEVDRNAMRKLAKKLLKEKEGGIKLKKLRRAIVKELLGTSDSSSKAELKKLFDDTVPSYKRLNVGEDGLVTLSK